LFLAEHHCLALVNVGRTIVILRLCSPNLRRSGDLAGGCFRLDRRRNSGTRRSNQGSIGECTYGAEHRKSDDGRHHQQAAAALLRRFRLAPDLFLGQLVRIAVILIGFDRPHLTVLGPIIPSLVKPLFPAMSMAVTPSPKVIVGISVPVPIDVFRATIGGQFRAVAQGPRNERRGFEPARDRVMQWSGARNSLSRPRKRIILSDEPRQLRKRVAVLKGRRTRCRGIGGG
jgi:hypothetical protein